MSQALDNLCGAGKQLKVEASDTNEIEGLVEDLITATQKVADTPST